MMMMIPIPTGVQVWLATGHTDMRRGFDGLALMVQEKLERDPHGGHLFVFPGRRGGLIKVLGTTARAYVCLRSAWNGAASSGHRRRTGRSRSRRLFLEACGRNGHGLIPTSATVVALRWHLPANGPSGFRR